MGGRISSTDAEATVMAGSGVTAEVRVTGPAETMKIAEGTGVHAGVKGIHPMPSTPRTDRDRSAVIRPTATEVGQDK